MAKHGFKVLWQRYIDKKSKQLAPVGTTEHVRDLRLIGPDGRAWGRPDGAIHMKKVRGYLSLLREERPIPEELDPKKLVDFSMPSAG